MFAKSLSAAVLAYGLLNGAGAFAEEELTFDSLDSLEYEEDNGICASYGEGYAPVPGTNTCLRVSGYVWTQFGTSSRSGGDETGSRARLQFDSRGDTEFGDFASQLRLQDTFGD
ncbi:porin [Hoeflea sp. WL0058]|uniref:Porin n=1 Tax=Flavimaribacter sediminis TaxID=2865987 RepID=A0AAE3D219_9HYPH|nr:porin [Flavimaribacter sediminis]MBW8639504.1 porin [Flavimaribacter sediminis]